MSSKADLCVGCGRFAPDGRWVEDEDGTWWICSDNPECVDGATVLDPQPPAPVESMKPWQL